MTFKQQVEKIVRKRYYSGGRAIDRQVCDIKEVQILADIQEILFAHNAELDRIAEGMPELTFPNGLHDIEHKAAIIEKESCQAYIQAQKGS